MQLILAITTVVFPSPHLFWGMRTGTCHVFVYMLFHRIPWEYLAVLYIVGKVFSRRIQCRQLQKFGGELTEDVRYYWELTDWHR